MSAKKRLKLTKRRVGAIITAAIVAVFVAALLITNIFIPVKYLFAYLVPREQRQPGVLTVTFLDVGYGDCAVCELPDGKVMLIDGGDGSYSNNLAILDRLNRRGIDKIDYLVCTSVLGEYCGGLAEIIEYKQVGRVFMPATENYFLTQSYALFCEQVNRFNIPKTYSHYGVGESGDGYFFTFLSPSSPDDPLGYYAALNSSPTEENMLNASAILWLEYAGTSFAFTSSAGRDALSDAVGSYKLITASGGRYAPAGDNDVVLENCDVVTVPGHGREECSHPLWYDTLKPSVAVISVGENYSGCPSAQAIADIGNVVSSPALTQVRGDITVTVTTEGYTLS